jgi:hypothetical protein
MRNEGALVTEERIGAQAGGSGLEPRPAGHVSLQVLDDVGRDQECRSRLG